jgi:hypothetical protein
MSRFLHLRLVRQINPYKTRSLIYYLIVFTKFLYIVEPTVRKRYTGITLTYHYNYTGQKLLVDCMYLLSAVLYSRLPERCMYVITHYSLSIHCHHLNLNLSRKKTKPLNYILKGNGLKPKLCHRGKFRRLRKR